MHACIVLQLFLQLGGSFPGGLRGGVLLGQSPARGLQRLLQLRYPPLLRLPRTHGAASALIH